MASVDQTALAITPLLDLVRPYTKSSDARMRSMINALHHVDRKAVRGDIVECGVWRAGNIMLARKLSPLRRCWLYDTFDGMPAPGRYDRKPNGYTLAQGKARVSRDDVRANLVEADCWDENLIRMVPGMVEDTLQHETNIPKAIAVLRLDTDFYESTKCELEVLYPRLERKGVLIVDDYGHWPGARKAVDDYFRHNPPRYEWIDYTAIMVVKP